MYDVLQFQFYEPFYNIKDDCLHYNVTGQFKKKQDINFVAVFQRRDIIITEYPGNDSEPLQWQRNVHPVRLTDLLPSSKTPQVQPNRHKPICLLSHNSNFWAQIQKFKHFHEESWISLIRGANASAGRDQRSLFRGKQCGWVENTEHQHMLVVFHNLPPSMSISC